LHDFGMLLSCPCQQNAGMKVSVLIPLYNARDVIRETIQTVLAQTWADREIEVVDDGPGLPPKAVENLFRPFRGSARAGGTGLGLAIARELIRVQGGDLRLAESGVHGARFAIELPERAG